MILATGISASTVMYTLVQAVFEARQAFWRTQ